MNSYSIIQKLKNQIKNKRVLVQIDGANLFFSSNLKKISIDYAQLISFFEKNCNLITAIFYTAFNPDDIKQLEFLINMEKLGYRLNKKPLKTFKDETKKGNLDVELTVDALSYIDTFDILILISGDGDFTYLIEKVENLGKQAIIFGVRGFVAFDLSKMADSYYFLERIPQVWKRTKKNQFKTSVKNTKDLPEVQIWVD